MTNQKLLPLTEDEKHIIYLVGQELLKEGEELFFEHGETLLRQAKEELLDRARSENRAQLVRGLSNPKAGTRASKLIEREMYKLYWLLY